MNWEDIPHFLPAILGVLRQEQAEGILSLEQNDGLRKLFWSRGELVFLQSDVAGEQFGNYLLRQGILDLPALNEILAENENSRIGERVVQAGLMTRHERDHHINLLLQQIMIHTLEHAVIEIKWEPCSIQNHLGPDLFFKLDHHQFVWKTLSEAKNLGDICDLLYAERTWKWEAPSDLLSRICDLPLNPRWAYALSFLGAEPIGFETFISIGNLDEHEAARLIMILWALGSLTLTKGDIPRVVASPWQTRIQQTVSQRIRENATQGAPVRPTTSPLPPPPMPEIPESLHIPLDVPHETPQSPVPEPPLAVLDAPAAVPGALDMLSTPIPPMPTRATDTDPSAFAEEGPEDRAEALQRAKALNAKAHSYILQDRVPEAIRLLEQAVQLDPDSEKAFGYWLQLGKLRLSNPAWSTRAIDALQHASRLNAKSGEPWAIMGELYLRKGFATNAIACFKKALELDPSIPVPQDLLQPPPDANPKESPGLFSKLGSGLKSMLKKSGE